MNKIDILVPEIFPPREILAGVTLKNGNLFDGKGITFSNIGARIFKDTEVEESKRLLSYTTGIEQSKFIFQKQVHGIEIQQVHFDTGLNVSDGLVTDTPGLAIAVKIADCAAVLAYDPIHRAIGAFHSGWKGTMQNIVKSGIDKMVGLFSCNPSDILVYVSPCASGENYEVMWDVAQHFPLSARQVSEDKYLFDNKKQIYQQLIDSGIKHEHIEVSGICTIADRNYHSYRRDKDVSGRMAAFIYMQ